MAVAKARLEVVHLTLADSARRATLRTRALYWRGTNRADCGAGRGARATAIFRCWPRETVPGA
jgi:hypothetical protein